MKKAVLIMLVAVFAAAMVSTNALAKEKVVKKGGSSVIGTLTLVNDADGKATGVTITAKSGTVYKLAELTQNVSALEGEEVIAKGEVKDDAGAMTLTVSGRVMAADKKDAKKEPKEKKKAAPARK